ncbi:MAG: hypothetical protein SFT93_05340 [Rickettsiaceae bacterium]|nr:hypothetical protein [Rickettsiaceae bacterium]
MSETEILLFVFIDTLTSHLVFMTNFEIGIYAALTLSNISKYKVLASGFLGVLLGLSINYFLGMMVANALAAPSIVNLEAKNPTYKKNRNILSSFINSYSMILVIFGFISIYSKVLSFFAGFSKSKFPFVICGISFVKMLFYNLNI